jgi:hypothetical protein
MPSHPASRIFLKGILILLVTAHSLFTACEESRASEVVVQPKSGHWFMVNGDGTTHGPQFPLAETKEGAAASNFVAGLFGCMCMVVVAGGGIFGLVWLIRRQKPRSRGGFEDAFEGGVRGAVSSGVDDAFERHRRQGRQEAPPRGGFEEAFEKGLRGGIASGIDEAMERHRRQSQEPQQPAPPQVNPPCYVQRQGQQGGPYAREQLQSMAAAGQLGAADLVWEQGTPQWVPAGQLGWLTIARHVPPPAPQPPPVPAQAAAPQPAGHAYYYSRHGHRLGPVSSQQLRHLAASGQLQPTDLVWIQDKQEWVPATKIKGLFPG